MAELKDLILLGMRKQLKTRNKVLLECLTVLSDIMPAGIPQIINQYIYGDDQYIHPDAANAFWNGSHTSHLWFGNRDIGLTIKAFDDTECCHSCCESGPLLKISVSTSDWHDDGIFPIRCAWNYIMYAYDDDMHGYVADRIADAYQTRCVADASASACNANKYAKCEEIARELLDNIRRQIIRAGDEEL